MYAVFYGSTFFGGGFFGGNVAGTGDNDSAAGKDRGTYKPTGLVERRREPFSKPEPLAETPQTDAVAQPPPRVTALDSYTSPELQPTALRGAEYVELATLLQKVHRTQEEELLLLMLMAAGSA